MQPLSYSNFLHMFPNASSISDCRFCSRGQLHLTFFLLSCLCFNSPESITHNQRVACTTFGLPPMISGCKSWPGDKKPSIHFLSSERECFCLMDVSLSNVENTHLLIHTPGFPSERDISMGFLFTCCWCTSGGEAASSWPFHPRSLQGSD